LASFRDDDYHECMRKLTDLKDALASGRLLSVDNVLSADDATVKEFLASDEVTALAQDKELFDYFFQTMDNLEEWTKYYDEPTRKVYYKYEEGMTLVSCFCEAIVDAPLLDTVSLFIEIDLFKDWFPNVTAAKILQPITPGRGLYQCQQTMPWPIWPRDMIFSASGMFDHTRGGVALSCIKSVDEGAKYFG